MENQKANFIGEMDVEQQGSTPSRINQNGEKNEGERVNHNPTSSLPTKKGKGSMVNKMAKNKLKQIAASSIGLSTVVGGGVIAWLLN